MNDLQIRELIVEYISGGYVVRPIDHLDLDSPTGSLALLLGPSGCGKSTLLSCLAGILSPTSGSIRLGDTEISGLSGAALTSYRRDGVGIVFQAFNLVPSLTATENVMAPMLAAGRRTSESRQRAEQLLARMNLEDRMDHRPDNLSGGQQQRVAIARALAMDPPLLLADEPTAHLDHMQVEAVLTLLGELAEPGRIVLIATHDDRLLPLADQVVEMVPSFAEDGGVPEHLELEEGAVVFTQGSWGDRIYTIERGEVEIVRQREDGTEEPVAIMGPGEHFGEMGPLFSLPRSATARVTEPATLTGYTLHQFRDTVGVDHLTDLVPSSQSTAGGR